MKLLGTTAITFLVTLLVFVAKLKKLLLVGWLEVILSCVAVIIVGVILDGLFYLMTKKGGGSPRT
jgi:hypothetical protein